MSSMFVVCVFLLLIGYLKETQCLMCYERTCEAGDCTIGRDDQQCNSAHACMLTYKPNVLTEISTGSHSGHILHASCIDVHCDERQQQHHQPLQGITEYCCTSDLCNHKFPDVQTGNSQCYDGGCTNDDDCLQTLIANKFISVCPMDPRYGCIYNKYVSGDNTTVQVGCMGHGTSCVPLSGDTQGTQIKVTCCNTDLCNHGNVNQELGDESDTTNDSVQSTMRTPLAILTFIIWMLATDK